MQGIPHALAGLGNAKQFTSGTALVTGRKLEAIFRIFIPLTSTLMTRTFPLLLFIGLLLTAGKAHSQTFTELGDGVYLKSGPEVMLTFNLLMGDDAEEFPLEYNGFGSISGLTIIDNFHYRADVFFEIGDDMALSLSSGVGTISKKYRFANAFIFRDLDNSAVENAEFDTEVTAGFIPQNTIAHQSDYLAVYEDPNANNDYGDGFFSYGKSKLILTYIRVPLLAGFRLVDLGDEGTNKFNVQVGGVFDYLVMARHKRKFENDGDREKEVVRGNDEIYAEALQYGLGARIEIGEVIGFHAVYMLTPMFQENRGPDLTQAEFTVSFSPF